MIVTAIYAIPMVLIYLVLSVRVISYRRSKAIGLGDGGDKSLIKRVRAHANWAEYAPISLLLLAVLETLFAPSLVLHVLGLLALLGRLFHAYGFSASPPKMGLRVAGMGFTLTMLICSVVMLAVLIL